MFQKTKHQDFIFFYLFGKKLPSGITKAPGAGS